MTTQVGVIFSLKQRFAGLWQQKNSLSIFARIAIANSLIILVGAIGGTVITHFETEQGVELVSILLFGLAGVLISIVLNMYIVRAALAPVLDLRRVVENIDSGDDPTPALSLRNPDPDTSQLAASLSSLIMQLEQGNRQLRYITGRAIDAQEEERKRIARSLHDETGQALLSLMLSLERLEKQIPAEQTEVLDRLASTRQLASDSLADLRRIIRDLRPAVLDDLGLLSAIRWYAQSNLEGAGMQVEINAPQELPPLPAEQSTTLFRVAQEAINNVVRHSQAKKALITLDCLEDEIRLSIEDDGVGFQADGYPGESIRLRQWGLAGIQERVNLVNGRFQLDSTSGRGTRLRVSVPFPRTQEAAVG
jgi:two-component system sensor histidine kinase UhpB